ncbi:MAG TPA: glycosyltransferase family 4 protein [Candidatus Paceibacterota bacterium]|nr:glycosyltransferase family 4 protein [Candidatus Paceibacterota bacterium]
MIFITSYPYVHERLFNVFRYFKDRTRLMFILPNNWPAKDGRPVEVPRDDIARVIPVPSYFFHSRYPIVRGILKGWMPRVSSVVRFSGKPGDVLYTAIEPNLLPTLQNSRLARRYGLKHVFFTWQNVPYSDRLRGWKLRMTEYIIKRTIRNSVGAICGNTKAAEIIRRYAPPNFKILVAPISGVDVERFSPRDSSFRSSYHLEGKIVITFAGAFDERKGLKTLLDAFAEVREKNTLVHLALIGTGRLLPELEEITVKRGLKSAVTFIPWLPNAELAGALAESDIFVYPSEPWRGWEEQFGFSMAEASACGVPVIATDTGSISEVIVDGKTGVLVPPRNSRRLAAAITGLAADPELRSRLGRSGREHIQNNFSHAMVAEKFESFFAEL